MRGDVKITLSDIGLFAKAASGLENRLCMKVRVQETHFLEDLSTVKA